MNDWTSPVYAFFEQKPCIVNINGRRAHDFKCSACRCKAKIRRYLDKKMHGRWATCASMSSRAVARDPMFCQLLRMMPRMLTKCIPRLSRCLHVMGPLSWRSREKEKERSPTPTGSIHGSKRGAFGIFDTFRASLNVDLAEPRSCAGWLKICDRFL